MTTMNTVQNSIITKRLILKPSIDERDLENYLNHLKEEDAFFYQYGMLYSEALVETITFTNKDVIYYSVSI